MPAQYFVHVESPYLPPQTRAFEAMSVIVGREQGDIVLGDPNCSARHAELRFDGRALEVRDLGSTNGTYLEGKRVGRIRWVPGQSIHIGDCTLRLDRIEPFSTSVNTAKMFRRDGTELSPSEPPVSSEPAAPSSQFLIPGVSKRRRWVLSAALTGATVALVGGALLLRPWDSETAQPETAQEDGTLTAPREATLTYVWVRPSADGKDEGGTSEAVVRIAPNPAAKVSVGVQEQFAGGGGDNWRMSLWMAAFNASRVARKSLTDYEFTLVTRGHVDGPSAGMLTTAVLLALMNNEELRSDTTITGTINPDGTAGPVGGIIEKMRGAQKAGLKRFGFPLETHSSESEGEPVDYLKVGKELGLEVKEIRDIASAYEFLTDKKVQQTKACDKSDLALPHLAEGALTASLAAWRERADKALEALNVAAYTRYLPRSMTKAMVAEVQGQLERAQRHDRGGERAAAHDGYAGVTVSARVNEALIKGVVMTAYGDYGGLQKLVKRDQPVREAVKALERHMANDAKNETLGMQLSTAFSYAYYVRARTAVETADRLREGGLEAVEGCLYGKKCPAKDETKANIMARAVMPGVYYKIAEVYVDMAEDLKEFPSDTTVAGPISEASLAKLLEGYASASGAVLETLDVTMISMASAESELTKDQVRGAIAQLEPLYPMARIASLLAAGAGEFSNESTMMRLAAAESAYVDGASILNRWYGLETERTKEGTLEVKNDRALREQLKLAEIGARRAAQQASDLAGYIPTAARYSYQVAEASREGNDEQRMMALSEYWHSTFWSELAASYGMSEATAPKAPRRTAP